MVLTIFENFSLWSIGPILKGFVVPRVLQNHKVWDWSAYGKVFKNGQNKPNELWVIGAQSDITMRRGKEAPRSLTAFVQAGFIAFDTLRSSRSLEKLGGDFKTVCRSYSDDFTGGQSFWHRVNPYFAHCGERGRWRGKLLQARLLGQYLNFRWEFDIQRNIVIIIILKQS